MDQRTFLKQANYCHNLVGNTHILIFLIISQLEKSVGFVFKENSYHSKIA